MRDDDTIFYDSVRATQDMGRWLSFEKLLEVSLVVVKFGLSTSES